MCVGVGILTCGIALAGCGGTTHHAGFSRPPATTQTDSGQQPSQVIPAAGQQKTPRLITPELLATILNDPRARMNIGPIPLSGVQRPLSSCQSPSRGAMRWVTKASQVAMYDMSTYLHAPATMDGVASIEARYARQVPDPLTATLRDLRRCGANGRHIVVNTTRGDHPAVRYSLGPPTHSIITLVATRTGRRLVVVAVSHPPSATAAANRTGGLLPSERKIIALALSRAQAPPR